MNTVGSPKRQYRRAIVAALALTLVAVACGESADSGAEGSGGASNDSLAGLLRFVPDTALNRKLVMGTDLELATRAQGITVPSGADEDELGEYVAALSGLADGAVSLQLEPFSNGAPLAVNEWRSEFGFSLLDTKRFVVAGIPPAQGTVFVVSRTPQQIEDAVKSDPVWSGDLKTETEAGFEYFSWSDNAEMRPDRRSAARFLGQGGQLASVEGVAIRTVAASTLVPFLDTVAGQPSLADDPDLLRAANLLGDAGAFDLVLSDDAGSEAPGPDQPTLGPYIALAFGSGRDGDTPLEVLVLLHADAKAATANVERLRAVIEDGESSRGRFAWEDRLTNRSIKADGNALVAVFETQGSSSILYNAWVSRDSLLFSS